MEIAYKRHIFGGLLPFVPVIVGVGLKFALVDKVAGPIPDHFYANYLRPAWIEFIVVAYITGLVSALSGGVRATIDVWICFMLPAACFVVCLVLVLGLPKAHIESPYFEVYLPFVISGLSLALSGGRIGK